MQTSIVIVSGSIINASTVHLNGLTPHITLYIETCIRRTPCTKWTLQHSPRVSLVTKSCKNLQNFIKFYKTREAEPHDRQRRNSSSKWKSYSSRPKLAVTNEDWFPIILPKSSHVSSLLIRHYQERVQHQRRALMHGVLRRSGYWILGEKSLINSIIEKYVKCKTLRCQSHIQNIGTFNVHELFWRLH